MFIWSSSPPEPVKIWKYWQKLKASFGFFMEINSDGMSTKYKLQIKRKKLACMWKFHEEILNYDFLKCTLCLNVSRIGMAIRSNFIFLSAFTQKGNWLKNTENCKSFSTSMKTQFLYLKFLKTIQFDIEINWQIDIFSNEKFLNLPNQHALRVKRFYVVWQDRLYLGANETLRRCCSMSKLIQLVSRRMGSELIVETREI